MSPLTKVILSVALLISSPAFAVVVATESYTGTVGTALSVIITTTPQGIGVSSGAAPPGTTYSIINGQGVLSGTPTQAGTYSFDVMVPSGDGVHPYFDEVDVQISGGTPVAGQQTVVGMTPGQVGVPLTDACTTDVGSQIFNGALISGAVPPGMQFVVAPPAADASGRPTGNANTYEIAGTPTKAGSYGFTIGNPNPNPFSANPTVQCNVVIGAFTIPAQMWWDPTQGGSGIFMQPNADMSKIYIAMYGYGQDAKQSAIWVYTNMVPLTNGAGTPLQAQGVYAEYMGQAWYCTGGQPIGTMNYTPPNCGAFGNNLMIQVNFTSQTSAVLTLAGQTSNLVPYPYQ